MDNVPKNIKYIHITKSTNRDSIVKNLNIENYKNLSSKYKTFVNYNNIFKKNILGILLPASITKNSCGLNSNDEETSVYFLKYEPKILIFKDNSFLSVDPEYFSSKNAPFDIWILEDTFYINKLKLVINPINNKPYKNPNEYSIKIIDKKNGILVRLASYSEMNELGLPEYLREFS